MSEDALIKGIAIREKEAWTNGHKAREGKKKKTTNPFHAGRAPEKFLAWNLGWDYCNKTRQLAAARNELVRIHGMMPTPDEVVHNWGKNWKHDSII